MATVLMRKPGDPNAPPIRVEVSDEVYQDGADSAAKLYLDSNQDVSNYIKGKLRLQGVPPTDLATLYNEARLHFAKHRQDSTRPGTDAFRLNLGFAGLGPEEGGGEGNPLPRGFSETYVAELKKLSDLRKELFEKRKTDPDAPGPIDLAVEGGKSDPEGMPFDITADNVETTTPDTTITTPDPAPPIDTTPDPAPPIPPAGNVDTQMDGAMNTGQSLGNLASSLAGAMPEILKTGEATVQNANTINIPTPVDPFKQYIDPDTNEIRQDLQGGDLGNLASLRALEGPKRDEALAGLQERLQARTPRGEEGRVFKGVFTGVGGGEAYDNYKSAVGTAASFADEYGKTTPIGEYANLAKNPTLLQGTLDEQAYMDAHPDVAEAIQRGDFTSAQDHYDRFGKFEGREAPTKGGTELKLDRIVADEDKEFLDKTDYTIDPTRFQATTDKVTAVTGKVPSKTAAGGMTAAERYDLVAKESAEAAKKEGLTDVVTGQKGVVDKEATVEYQLSNLMTQFEDGKIPPFAAGAIRTAEQRLAARGMGASSMAGAAIVQAAMEASTPIAAADAQTYRSMQEKNLDNRQQAEVLNAQMTLQLDIANLNNEQQTRIFNTGNRVQSLFSDQAAINSAKQFNASSAQQNDQFFANLFNSSAQFYSNQKNAVAMNNAGRADATSQFNSTLASNRELAYQKNSILIDQANTVYRRQINTANTAIKNAETEYNTNQLFNLQQDAKNKLLQDFKDREYFARTLSRDDKQFDNTLALSSFAFDRNLKTSKEIAQGRLVGGVLAGVADSVFNSIFEPDTPTTT